MTCRRSEKQQGGSEWQHEDDRGSSSSMWGPAKATGGAQQGGIGAADLPLTWTRSSVAKIGGSQKD